MATRSPSLYRCHLFSYAGPQSAGLTSQWTQGLQPVGDRVVRTGERVQLHVIVDDAASVSATTKVRFDILEQDFLLTGGLDDRIVEYVGTGAAPSDEPFTREQKTTVYRQLAAGAQLDAAVRDFEEEQDDVTKSILIAKEAGAGKAHVLAWWVAARLEDLLESEYYFIAVLDGVEDQSDPVLNVTAEPANTARTRVRFATDPAEAPPWIHGEPATLATPARPLTRTPRPATGTPTRAAAPAAAGAPAARDQWTEVGPAETLRAFAAGRPRGGGAVRALAVSDDGRRVYAGTASGGIWYSGDGGERWTPLDFHASINAAAGGPVRADALAVGAIAVRWGADAAADLVYAGGAERPPTTVGAPVAEAAVRATGIRTATGPAARVIAGGPAAAGWTLEATNLTGMAVARLALDRAADGVVWAATSGGLYRRPAGPAAVWIKVDPRLGGDDVTDVAVVPGAAGEPQRVYVATAAGRLAWSTDGTAWTEVTLPAFPPAQVAAGVPLQRVRLAAGNVPGHVVLYALAAGPRLWRIDGGTAAIVSGVPAALSRRGAGEDLAVAVHPANDPAVRDLIALGGWGVESPAGTHQAALYVGRVTPAGTAFAFPATGGPPPAEWVGDQVPPGVRALAWVRGATPTQLWVGTESGIVRSAQDGRGRTFAPRNAGRAATNAVALAQHPAAPDVLLLGAEGAVLRATGRETWEVRLGAYGGGVAIDGEDGRRMYAQVYGADWRESTDGGETFAPLEVMTSPPGRPAWRAAQAAERAASAAVSRMALVTRRGSANTVTQLALGTSRVWYTDDDLRAAAAGSGRSGWVTLPAGSDPYDPANPRAPDAAQDDLGACVLALAWATPDRLYALTETSVVRIARDPGGPWRPLERLHDRAHPASGGIPADLWPTALAVQDPARGSGSLYVGGANAPGASRLWFYDGRWRSTGLPESGAVHAIAVDPDHREVVYAGTDEGVWRGTAAFTGAGAPSWAWTRFSDGLPEAPCADLLVHAPRDGARRLLRAALGGRGVWEVALDGVAQGREVFLRAHGQASRQGDVPAGGARDAFRPAQAQVRLDASPDIRIRRAAGGGPAPVAAFPVPPGDDEYLVWLLQSALRASGKNVEADGRWSPAAAAALRARQAELGLPAAADVPDAATWARLQDQNPLGFDAGPPDHADLAAHFRDEPDRWPKGIATSTASSDAAHVYVTVHSRHWTPVAAADVRVTLLRAPFGRDPALAGVPPLPADWADRVRNGTAMPAGPWQYVDAARPSRVADAPLEPRYPQVVRFENVALTGGDTWNKPGWLILAVVHAPGADPLATAETDVATLVRTDHHVAARSVRKARVPAEPLERYPGLDIGGRQAVATMNRAWDRSNLLFTGMYLSSPMPYPGDGANAAEQIVAPQTAATVRGHNRMNVANAPSNWMNGWRELRPDWGIAPIYWGQQEPRNNDGPDDLRTVVALWNAQDAHDKAVAASIPAGAVLYLDWEWNGNLNTSPAGLLYCLTFWRRLAELGYRPGVYAFPIASAVFRRELPGLSVWTIRVDAHAPGIWRITDGQLIFESAGPVSGPRDPDSLLRQWIQPHPPPPPVLPALGGANPVGVGFDPDFDVAVVQDPAFPEARSQPAQVRGGAVAATRSRAGECTVYAVRRGAVASGTWATGGMGPRAAVADPRAGTDRRYARLWNPFTRTAALQAGGAEWVLGLGYAEADGEHAYRIQTLRQPPGGRWELETVPDAGVVVDTLAPIAATAVGNGVQVIAAAAGSQRLAGARWTPETGTWSRLAELQSAAGPATTAVRGTSRAAIASRGPRLLDVVWLGEDGILWASSWTEPGPWSARVALTAPAALELHPLAHVVAVPGGAGRLDVLVVARPPVPAGGAWRLRHFAWTAAGWGAARVAGGAATDLEPLAPIGAVSRTADGVDAYAVGADGTLYLTQLVRATNTWSALTRVGGAPVFGGQALRLASVDAALGDAADAEVVCTGRDGNAYATSWSAAAGVYADFRSISTLDLA